MGNLLSRTPDTIHPSNAESYKLCSVQFFGLASLDKKPLCDSRRFIERKQSEEKASLTAGACKLKRLPEHPKERWHCPRCKKVFLIHGTPAWELNTDQGFPTYDGPWFTSGKVDNGGIVALSLQVSGR